MKKLLFLTISLGIQTLSISANIITEEDQSPKVIIEKSNECRAVVEAASFYTFMAPRFNPGEAAAANVQDTIQNLEYAIAILCND